MKIEKGKLYYHKGLKKVFKAQVDSQGGDHITNKLAVHCPTKEDWEYVKSKGYFLADTCSFQKGYYQIDGDGWCNDNGEWYNNNGYHVITIDQFKQFYPEDKKKLSLPIVDNSNVDNIIEILKVQTQLDFSIEAIERELERLKELKQKINNILK